MTPQEIAEKFEGAVEAGKEFSKLSHQDKVAAVAAYLDAEIGTEASAEIKTISIPGLPVAVSGDVLEKASDYAIKILADFIVKKFFTPSA